MIACISHTQSTAAADTAVPTSFSLSRPPQRTAESTFAVASGHPLAGHVPFIHSRLHRLATIRCENYRL